MTWLNKHKRIWRATILLLLLLALMGPWAFDKINVPAEYPCSPPNFRLEGDFCGVPLLGMRVFLWTIGGIMGMLLGLVMGSPISTGSVGEILGASLYLILIILILFPFISTLRLMRSGDLRRNQIINIVVILSGFSRLHLALWGLWLYIGLAAGALILEVLLFTTRRTASQG